MNRNEKDQMINSLADKLENANIFYITDVSELNAEDTSKLRRQCFKSNIQLQVVKNTLLIKAMKKVNREYDELFDILKGPTSIMFSDTGNAPAKLIKNFRKEYKKPVLKGAFIEEVCYIGDDQLETLANIKSREELIADVVALLQSPAKNVISALQSGGNTIAGLVKTLSEKEEK